MTEATLDYLSGLMHNNGIPYHFMRWEGDLPDDYYFVGEYSEHEMMTMEEDGMQDVTFILRGYTKKQWHLLHQAKEKIRKLLPQTATLADGTGVAIFYSTGNPVPTIDADEKSIKIDLLIKEWKVK